MRKVRVLCAAMLCALAVCVAAVVSAQELSDYSRLFGVLQSTDGESDVNLREAPSMDAPLVGVYRCGVRAQAVKEKDGWLLVEVGGDGIGCLRGYVLEKYFKPAYSVEYESGFPVMRLSAPAARGHRRGAPGNALRDAGVPLYGRFEGTVAYAL